MAHKQINNFVQEGTVFCTTHGWDGKDYEGEGREFKAWKLLGDKQDRVFICIYAKRAYNFLRVCDYKSEKGVNEVDLYTWYTNEEIKIKK